MSDIVINGVVIHVNEDADGLVEAESALALLNNMSGGDLTYLNSAGVHVIFGKDLQTTRPDLVGQYLPGTSTLFSQVSAQPM